MFGGMKADISLISQFCFQRKKPEFRSTSLIINNGWSLLCGTISGTTASTQRPWDKVLGHRAGQLPARAEPRVWDQQSPWYGLLGKEGKAPRFHKTLIEALHPEVTIFCSGNMQQDTLSISSDDTV